MKLWWTISQFFVGARSIECLSFMLNVMSKKSLHNGLMVVKRSLASILKQGSTFLHKFFKQGQVTYDG